MAAAGGVEVAHAGGDGVKAVQRLAKGVQRQRLHVVFQIGPLRSGDERTKAPSCDGAMLIGPDRFNAYSAAIMALPHSELARVFSVRVPCTW
jgi:hypothetical protein